MAIINAQISNKDKLLQEIQIIKAQLQNASTHFELESDSDLIESTIYEIEALKARYRYLVKSAKAVEVN